MHLSNRSRVLAALLVVAVPSLATLIRAWPRLATPANRADERAAWLARLVSDGRTNELADLTGDDCVRCHQAVGEEWRVSSHALAWQDELYQKELAKIRRKKGCQGCHVPQPLAASATLTEPVPRQEQLHLGVHCTSCHLDADGRTVLGPTGNETPAHPTRRASDFAGESNALCIRCHATTIGPVLGIAADFVATKQEELGLSCVGCHMPALERPWANRESSEEGEPHPERRSRSHRLMTPRDPVFLREAFQLEARVETGRAILSVTNECGHRVPGLEGRRIVLRARLLDGEDRVLSRGELAFDHRVWLPVEGARELDLEGTGKVLEVTGWHESPGAREPQLFLERRFDL